MPSLQPGDDRRHGMSMSGQSKQTSSWTTGTVSARITVAEIAVRLDIGRLAVYEMLEGGILPGIRLNRRWIITRYAYEQWERTCGMQPITGLIGEPEVSVLN
jgi:excisionase family DNA binding protein